MLLRLELLLGHYHRIFCPRLIFYCSSEICSSGSHSSWFRRQRHWPLDCFGIIVHSRHIQWYDHLVLILIIYSLSSPLLSFTTVYLLSLYSPQDLSLTLCGKLLKIPNAWGVEVGESSCNINQLFGYKTFVLWLIAGWRIKIWREI